MFEEEEKKVEKFVLKEEKNYEKLMDAINWRNFVNLATIVSITMIAFYGLGALKHWKEIGKMK
jgi:uncharacterized iron-regulated protein